MSDMLKGKNKTGWQIHAINNMKKLYESQENVIKLFDKCFWIVSETKYKAKYREVIEILTPKQMIQRLPIALTQVKAGNTSGNLLYEIRQITHSLYWATETKESIQQWTEFNKCIRKKQILHLSILQIVKHLMLTDYYSILQVK